MTWYRQGFEQPDMARGRRQGKAGGNRYWLKQKSKGKFMFMDGVPYCIFEHNPYIGGQRPIPPTTCPGPDSPDGCPLDDAGDEPDYVGFLTVADFQLWTDDKGREHTFTKKLFAMKSRVWKIMAAAAEKRGDLTGWIVEAQRLGTEAEPATGGVYDFEELVPKSEWKARFGSKIVTYGDQTIETYLQPIDYESVLAPKSTAELRRLAKQLLFKGNGDTKEDDIPFMWLLITGLSAGMGLAPWLTMMT